MSELEDELWESWKKPYVTLPNKHRKPLRRGRTIDCNWPVKGQSYTSLKLAGHQRAAGSHRSKFNQTEFQSIYDQEANTESIVSLLAEMNGGANFGLATPWAVKRKIFSNNPTPSSCKERLWGEACLQSCHNRFYVLYTVDMTFNWTSARHATAVKDTDLQMKKQT